MIIAIFGVTCVGKTTIGELIANDLNYAFFDLDAEMKRFYNDTIENIQRCCIGDELDIKKTLVLKDVLEKCGDSAVIAMSPIYYSVKYKLLFRNNNVLSILLQDSPENIVKRLVYTDDFDLVIENPKRDNKAELKDIRYFISRYKKAFDRIEQKHFIDGKTADVAANEIIETIIKPYCAANGIEV